MNPLEKINAVLKEEHGNPVTESSLWSDAGVDSFGTTMVFFELDREYECFKSEWLDTVEWEILTIQNMLDRIQDESAKL